MTETLTAIPPTSGFPLPLPITSTSTPSPEKAVDSTSEINCICDFTDDDGYTICCDKCETWQHYVCMGLPKDKAPSQYQCSRCLPRPVDATKANELQKARRKRDEAAEKIAAPVLSATPSTSHKRKKATPSTSHKKKESIAGVSNGVSTTKATTTEKTNGKLPSPRESQAPTSRKRNGRTSHGASAAASPGAMATCDDSEGEDERLRFEYTEISNFTDRYANDDVKQYMMDLAIPEHAKHNDVLKPCSQVDFQPSKASIRTLPDNSKTLSVHPRYGFMLDSSCAKGKPIAVFNGEIGFQEAYKKKPTNQWSAWHHPKHHVLFHPILPIYIDARISGSKARFIRRSCRPNVTMNAVWMDGVKVAFALFANENLKTSTELTIGWDFRFMTQIQKLEASDFDFSKLSDEECHVAGEWAKNLLDDASGECACNSGDDCLMLKIKRAGCPPSPPRTIANGRKKRPSPRGSKEATPAVNDDDDSRTDTTVRKRKSSSREITPHDTAVDSMPMTSREERKFKDVLSRIQKQEQEERHTQGTKRRKRTSTVSIPNGDTLKVDKTRDKDGSRSNSPLVMEVADASTGRRRTSGSSTSSEGHKHHKKVRSGSTTDHTGSSAPKSRRKVVSKDAASKYVDSFTQTEVDDDLPWWRSPSQQQQRIVPREPRIPLRKRLMQTLLRCKEEESGIVATDSCLPEKRKLNDASPEQSPTSPTKMMKVGDNGEAKKIDSPASSPTITVSEPPAPSAELMSKPPGPALADLFADTDNPPVSPPSNGTVPVVNGTRPTGLHLQLPSPCLPNGTQPPSAGTPTFSPGVASAIGGPQPSPTRAPKKLSLGDYSKRFHHKTAENKEDGEKTSSINGTKMLFGDGKKLSEILAPPTPTEQPTPTANTDQKNPAVGWSV